MSIATKLAKLKTIKQDIKSALEEKGQTPSNVFSTYANNIRAIETGITPTGELSITENGTYDVTNYASANVNVASSGGSDIDKLIDGSLTELNSNATSVRSNAFYNYSKLINVNLPNATDIKSSAFMYCSRLFNINIPNTQKIYDSAFYNCQKLESLYAPRLTNIYDSYVFNACYYLKEILIEQTTSICTLNNINSFDNCYHIKGITHPTVNPNGLKDGYIYVPHTLLTQYKVATNWVTYKSQIIGHGDFNAGENFQNYADGTTYTSCMWYSDKELTTLVGGWSVADANVGSAPTGTTSAPTAGRYYCKLD